MILAQRFTPGGGAVLLTDPVADDSQVLFAWINDPQLVRFNSLFSPVSWEQHSAWFAGLDQTAAKRMLVIRDREGGPAIGTIQLIDIHPVHRSAELTVRIGSDDHRGVGLGTTALDLACRYGFESLGLNRIWLRVFATNGRAIRAYEKAGFQREGVMRQACRMDEEWVDMVVMARLAT